MHKMPENVRCIKCHSPKIVRFIDGFGDRRIYCRNCSRSFLFTDLTKFRHQRMLPSINS